MSTTPVCTAAFTSGSTRSKEDAWAGKSRLTCANTICARRTGRTKTRARRVLRGPVGLSSHQAPDVAAALDRRVQKSPRRNGVAEAGAELCPVSAMKMADRGHGSHGLAIRIEAPSPQASKSVCVEQQVDGARVGRPACWAAAERIN